MKLAANLVIHNELERYLLPCIDSLLGFCDEVSVWDDGSTDATEEALGDYYHAEDRVRFHRDTERCFFANEGKTRQAALEWALSSQPTHILAIDADELILEGDKLRQQLGQGEAWSLCMREVWKARANSLEIRQDGGWCEHPVSVLWRVPRVMNTRWRIPPVKLACGRIPAPVGTIRARFTDVAIYHFGWACKPERQDRYQRYADHDGGRFHRNSHIESIMWPDMNIVATTDTVKVPKVWVDRANLAMVR